MEHNRGRGLNIWSLVAAAKAKSRTRTAIGIVAAGLLILVGSLVAVNRRRSALDELWGPVLRTPGEVLVCVGAQAAYNLRSARAHDEIQGVILPPPNAAKPHGPIREDELILLRDRYVAWDDALCLARVTSLLERYRKPYRVRVAQSTFFADLRDTHAVLIGAFDNPRTLGSVKGLRFTFRHDNEQDTGMVLDSRHPGNSEWKLVGHWPNWDMPVDYAIVTRMVDTTTDRPIIIAAGLTQYGALGAGEFLSDQEYFAEAARHLPMDWSKKNLQIVLSVPVVNRIPGRPRVLATHVW